MLYLGDADEERLLGILDGPAVLLSVVLHVAQLLAVPPLELVGGRFVPGNLVNSVSFVVVAGKDDTLDQLLETHICEIMSCFLYAIIPGTKKES